MPTDFKPESLKPEGVRKAQSDSPGDVPLLDMMNPTTEGGDGDRVAQLNNPSLWGKWIQESDFASEVFEKCAKWWGFRPPDLKDGNAYLRELGDHIVTQSEGSEPTEAVDGATMDTRSLNDPPQPGGDE